jgi:hypothetical protein
MKTASLLFLVLLLLAGFGSIISCGGGGGGAPSPSGITSWMFVDGNGTNGINKVATQNASSPQLTVLGTKLYATWAEPNGTTYHTRVAVYNGNDSSPAWVFVDGNGANGINKDATKSAMSPQLTALGGKLYATWQEYNGSNIGQVRVAVYNGNDASPSWAFVDGNGANGINKDATKGASSPQLAVSGSKLYATWGELNATANQIRVAVYNGIDASPSWTFVDKGTNGINKDAAKAAYGPQLALLGNKLYATWDESNGTTDQIRVAVYNGNDFAPVWTFVDGDGTNGINKDTARSANSPQVTSFGSSLYATWVEYNGIAYQVRIAAYNGDDVSPSWAFVDGNGTSGINWNAAEKTYSPHLAVCYGALYANWDESNKVRVAVYNGNDFAPAWTFVDGNGTNGLNKDAANSASHSQLIAFADRLYATWQEKGQIRVAVGK